jgi:exosome complex RNA-binding protein Rrp4
MNDLNTLILIDNTDKPEQVTFENLPVNSVFKDGDSLYLKIKYADSVPAVDLKTGYTTFPARSYKVTPLKATLTIEKA